MAITTKITTRKTNKLKQIHNVPSNYHEIHAINDKFR